MIVFSQFIFLGLLISWRISWEIYLMGWDRERDFVSLYKTIIWWVFSIWMGMCKFLLKKSMCKVKCERYLLKKIWKRETIGENYIYEIIMKVWWKKMNRTRHTIVR